MTIQKINWCVTWGAMAAATGALLTVGWPTLFHLCRRRMMVLTNGSITFNIWQTLPIPIYTEIYLYNISNVDDILAGKNVRLRVQQMGPYVFRETQTKVNVIWNANSTLSYQTRRVWHFQPDRSNGSLSDIVTNINPLIPSIAYVLRDQNTMLQILANMVTKLYYSNIFLSGNVSSWLFDGIESHLLSISSRIPNFPYYVPYDRIGWLYTRNGSADYEKWFVVNTGAEDFSQFGQVELWDHVKQTVYPGNCGKVRGSTGELWAPKPDQPEISIFTSDLRTTLTLAATSPVNIRGIEGMMFVANDSLFDNGQKYSSKACYCEDTHDDCMPSGVLNASACAFGAPTFATLPHFRHVHPYYADKIDGLEPTEDHDFKMAIEMVTGMPLMVNAALQANILVRHNNWMSINNQLPDPDVLVPMVWALERVSVNDLYSFYARLALNIYNGMSYLSYVLTAVGVALLSVGLWKSFIRHPKIRSSEIAETRIFLTRNDSN